MLIASPQTHYSFCSVCPKLIPLTHLEECQYRRYRDDGVPEECDGLIDLQLPLYARGHHSTWSGVNPQLPLQG